MTFYILFLVDNHEMKHWIPLNNQTLYRGFLNTKDVVLFKVNKFKTRFGKYILIPPLCSWMRSWTKELQSELVKCKTNLGSHFIHNWSTVFTYICFLKMRLLVDIFCSHLSGSINCKGLSSRYIFLVGLVFCLDLTFLMIIESIITFSVTFLKSFFFFFQRKGWRWYKIQSTNK